MHLESKSLNLHLEGKFFFNKNLYTFIQLGDGSVMSLATTMKNLVPTMEGFASKTKKWFATSKESIATTKNFFKVVCDS